MRKIIENIIKGMEDTILLSILITIPIITMLHFLSQEVLFKILIALVIELLLVILYFVLRKRIEEE